MGIWDTPPSADELNQSSVPESPTTPKSVPQGRAAALGFAQGGTFGFADELGSAVGSLFLPRSGVRFGPGMQPSPDDTPEVRALKESALAGKAAEPSGYRTLRDLMRGELDQARAEYPKTVFASELAGGLAVPVPGGGTKEGAGFLARMLAAGAKGAGVGAAYGLGTSGADLLNGDVRGAASDVENGMFAGAAGGVFGQGLGEAVGAGGRALGRIGQRGRIAADKGLDDLAQAKVLKDMGSASGELGAATQAGNRLVENLMRLEAAGALNAEQTALLASMKASGEWGRLQAKLADSNLKALTSATSEIESREGVLAGMQAGRGDLFAAARQAAADPMAQLAPRLKRYAAPGMAAMLGPAAGGIAGLAAGGSMMEIAGGALLGAGIRPAIQSVVRGAKHPAVQRPLYALLERAGTPGRTGAQMSRAGAVSSSEAEPLYFRSLADLLREPRMAGDGQSDPWASNY